MHGVLPHQPMGREQIKEGNESECMYRLDAWQQRADRGATGQLGSARCVGHEAGTLRCHGAMPPSPSPAPAARG